MKSSDRMILAGVALAALVAAFWFLLLAPKREEASKLEDEVAALAAEVDEAEQAAVDGEAAKKGFANDYRKLVSLGKAVPKDADTSSLLVQLEDLSARAGVDFRSITLDQAAAGSAAAPAPTPPPPPPATTPAGTTTPGATPSEATAALLPIGATVGPAGLPLMPYALEFQGGFFQVADFFGAIDRMVQPSKKGVRVDGRLLTINGFSLTAGAKGFPSLTADVQASSYLTPADQGVTAGATPAGPAAPAPAPASSAAAAPAPPATATATPPTP
jgi:hypothetical protein